MSLVRIGDAVGLYKILHARGPMTVAELAAEAGVNQRYLCEWLSHQAASNYLAYDPATQSFTLPPEQALVFAIDDSPVSMLGAFDVMAAMLEKGRRSSRRSGRVAGCPGAIRLALRRVRSDANIEIFRFRKARRAHGDMVATHIREG